MPRVRPPPTPATSTGPAALENLEMDNYNLPPSAITPPPLSPVLNRKRTLSGSQDLPPPPSRARKIIQMKPKDDAPSKSPSTSTSPKRKQPSATSAAGRKIARKTAHSIIERRRRSKMNEEFGVLKDMIPACNGVEMHKLAILQAGIEYVRYLQGCVEKLQNENGSQRIKPPPRPSPAMRNEDEDDVAYRHESSASESSAQPSPAIAPQQFSPAIPPQVQRYSPNASAQNEQTQTLRESAQQNSKYSTSPPPLVVTQTGISPAFNAIQFSPDLSRHAQWKQSPNILPLPQAAMAMPGMQLGNSSIGSNEEATATAALMMLTNDRRSGRGGMSVKDLLSH